MSHLELADVHKGYADQAVLTGVDLAVAAESVTAILGPSGSGKTTLLRLVAGFDPIDSGRDPHRRDHGRRRTPLRATRAAPAGLRPPGGRPVPPPHRGRQRRLRPVAPPPPASPGARAVGHGRAGRSRTAISRPALRWPATASGPGPGPRRRTRRWCCWTNPSRPSTPPSGPASAPRYGTSCAGPGPPPCWSPTTRTRRCRWPTRWRSCAAGGSCSTVRPTSSTPPRPIPSWPRSWARPTCSTR